MTKGRALHLVPVLLACLGVLAAGCGEGGRTPTSPEPLASVAASAQAAAPAPAATPATEQPQAGPLMAVAAVSTSRGGGLPRKRPEGSTPERHGGAPPRAGNSGGGSPVTIELALAVQPDVWSLDDAHGPGTVTALITGSGLAAIDLRSIVLVGSSKSAAPLAPRRVVRTGSQVQATFSEAGAIATLDAPIAGERERIDVRLSAGGATQSLSAYLHIVGSSSY